MLRLLLVLSLFPVLAAPVAAAPVVAVLGDSLSAAHGMDRDDSWVALLEDRMAAEGFPHEVVNASISGETSRGGRDRVDGVLADHEPAVLIVELGGNDGLRGQPLSALRENLAAIVERGQEAGAEVLLLGVRLPPNYGPGYVEGFAEVYRAVADTTGAALVPQLLEGVGERRELMQGDGIHPTAAAQPTMLDNMWPALEPLLEATRDLTGDLPEQAP
ncbi:arylesterase [Thiohalospira halophila]|uniref:arylesterase n=1 Tax=Thiohalospira halophila TaxID=381300 RepID=UPI001F0782D1|nr:arylesterase [Thiohalospira halophila]